MANLDFTSEMSSIASEAFEIGREEAANAHLTDILSISTTLLPEIQIYRSKFNSAFLNFVDETEKTGLRDAIKEDREKGVEIKLYAENIKGKKANELASVMMEGLMLLNRVRSVLTGTTISTQFYHASDDGRMVPVNIANLKPVLSLYSASGTLSNPVNLAFEAEGEITELVDSLEENSKEDGIQHYLKIMDRAKDLYVDQLNSNSKTKRYTKFWDSTDAEILELLIQRKAKTLAIHHYTSYRRHMGNKGKQTTLLQMGDIGAIQVKYFGKKQKQVNVLRFSMLRNTLFKLEQAFSQQNLTLQKQQLKDIFLPKTSELHDEFSRELNRDAVEYFNSLFSKFI